jgi:methyl-accepting chemotaxis protein
MGLIVAGALSVTLFVSFTFLLVRQQQSSAREREDSVQRVRELLVGSLTYSMTQGITDVLPFIEQSKKLRGLRDLRVVPSDAIKAGSSKQLDSVERQVESNQVAYFEPEVFNGERVIRAVQSVAAEDACLQCHQVPKGSSLAVVSMRYSIEEAEQAASSQRWFAVIMTVLTIVLTSAVVLYFVNKQILNDLMKAVKHVKAVGEGDVDEQIVVTRKDEIGTLESAIHELQSGLKQKADVATAIAKGNLDVDLLVSSPKDALGNAMVGMKAKLKALSDDTQSLVHAGVNGHLGVRVDPEKHDGEFRKIIEGMNHTLDAVTQPLYAATGYLDMISNGNIPHLIDEEYYGDFASIKESLNKVIRAIGLLTTDTQGLCSAALAGNLSYRANPESHQGDFKGIVEGVNQTLDAVIKPLNEASAYINDIALGKKLQPISADYKGDFAILKKNINDCINILHGLLGETAALTEAATNGALSVRADVGKFQGQWRDLVTGMNRTLDAVIGPLNTAAICVDKISRGEIPDQISEQYRGDFNTLKNNLNRCIDAVNLLIKDVRMLAGASVNGNLSVRANVTAHQGDFRKIVEGFNSTLDSVIAPVTEGVSVLSLLAGGDLTHRVVKEYSGEHRKIKESINQVAESLEQAISEVREAVKATADAANLISSSTEQMAAGAQEQTSQTSEVATSIEAMTKTIMENSENAQETVRVAKDAKSAAEAGGEVVKETVNGMRRIAVVVERSGETVKELGRSSDQIGAIVNVIDDIADQTNLLALNAAIEAARAGEQGRGFAVVADEVRKLAERTTKATKEIALMIKKIQADTTGAVSSMEEGTKQVRDGIALADRAGQSLSDIVTVSQRVTDMVLQIATASEEQSTSSEEISKNVEAIATVTGQTATGTEQIARTAEELNRLTDNLQHLVSKFIVRNTRSDREPRHSDNTGVNRTPISVISSVH